MMSNDAARISYGALGASAHNFRSILTRLLLGFWFVAPFSPVIAANGPHALQLSAYVRQLLHHAKSYPTDYAAAPLLIDLSVTNLHEALWTRTVKERREFGAVAILRFGSPDYIKGKFSWSDVTEGTANLVYLPEINRSHGVTVGDFHTHPPHALDYFSFQDVRNFSGDPDRVFRLMRSRGGYFLLMKTRSSRKLLAAPYEIAASRAWERGECKAGCLPFLLRYALDSGLVYYQGEGAVVRKVARATPSLPTRFIASGGRGPENELSWMERVAVQAALKYQHDATLTVDGQFGAATRSAIKEFQRARGSSATGYLSDADLMALFEPMRYAAGGWWISTDHDLEGASGVLVAKTYALEGHIEKDNLQGQSRFITADGVTVEGEFKDGLLEGRGLRRFVDAHEKGEFVHGRLRSGVRAFASGQRQEGTFDVEGQIIEGVVRYADGATARGHFDEDKRLTGEGEYVDHDGVVATGMFRNGTLQGYGMKRFPDGQVQKGVFRNGILNGQETLPRRAGKVREGAWSDGKLVRRGLTDSDGRLEVTADDGNKKFLRPLD